MDPAAAAAGGQPLQDTSPPTDPAELRAIIVRQGALIRSFQDQVEALQSQLQITSTAAPPPLRDPPAPCGESPRLTMPEKYGSADRCRGFLCQCENFFAHQPGVYRNDGTKCAFLLSLLMGRALDWAFTVWNEDPQIRTSFTYFAGMIREVFDLRPDYPRPCEPMQLGRSWLTEREHQQCTQMRLCYYCGGSGHLIHWCSEKPSSAQVALIDSGAAINLIDTALVEELQIPTIPCMPSLRITAIDSQPMGGGYLTHQTELLDFKVGLFHREHLAFYAC
ncbi:hypothetical protein QTP70_010588 [Hemibagrus guttatus]|uniref:CCHC-type domain-containing protein n=1 Tax=Hemibagrus guttatus TaxID=175788 RepID=A0AAE0ULU7_9TELE|nr:hypothetical protein QTP70_010588 [Hemibagrus guttatus]KAK3530634.1 hypothetical protein QTP86_029556 [Hemibagrus guttatus]